MSLDAYKQKRTFNNTPEPSGGRSNRNALIFVIQKHHASHLHYDFRLEMKGVLKSWAIPKGPSINAAHRRLAQLVEDHPFDYKDFEGIIPEGNYGAGAVIIWDEGTYEPAESTGDKEQDEKLLLKQFYSGKISIVLKGKKLKGAFTLIKTPSRGEKAWLLSKQNDTYAKADIDITEKDQSVISGLTIEEMKENAGAAVWHSNRMSRTNTTTKKRNGIPKKMEEDAIIISPAEKKKDFKSITEFIKRDCKDAKKTKMPSDLFAMLATRTAQPFNHPDWLFEIKWDGFRSLGYVNEGKVQLRSRSNLSYNKTYPVIVEQLETWPVNAVVDGEIVVLNEQGKPDFEALQNYGNRQEGNIVYYLFDILWLDGIDLMNTPLAKRKEILQKLTPINPHIRFSEGIDEVGIDFFELVKKNEIEGIVAKRKDSLYLPGKRTGNWLKIPTEIRQEFVIGGYTESDSGRPFRSLLFGYYENGKLINVGHAGGGFKERQMKQILSRLKKLETKKKTFVNEVEADTRIHWVKPELVAEIKYASWTAARKIRKPAIFLGFRDDKSPREVVKEIDIDAGSNNTEGEPKIKEISSDSNWPKIETAAVTSEIVQVFGERKLRLTNIEKKLWGQITKAHLLMYYHDICPFIMPYLKHRPLSLHIKPNGPTAPGFYIKDMESRQPSWAELYTMKRKHKAKGKREAIDYLVCNEEATLQYIINLGCIDVNPWNSRVGSPEEPDFIIIDLDPSDNDFSKVTDTAKAAKELFDQKKITAFPKTSGKTGMHLYLPCLGFSFPEARTIAENICKELHKMMPSITTTEISINNRGDKLYLDPNQNDFADTVAAPYSVRPYHLPTVSTPLEWKEINSKLDPAKLTMDTVRDRLKKKGDLWKRIMSEKIKLSNSKILKTFLRS